MKTTKENFFCNEFTFYDHYNIDKVIEINHVRDCVILVLSNCDFISEGEIVRVLGVLGDISLMIIDGMVENINVGINLQLGLF